MKTRCLIKQSVTKECIFVFYGTSNIFKLNIWICSQGHINVFWLVIYCCVVCFLAISSIFFLSIFATKFVKYLTINTHKAKTNVSLSDSWTVYVTSNFAILFMYHFVILVDIIIIIFWKLSFNLVRKKNIGPSSKKGRRHGPKIFRGLKIDLYILLYLRKNSYVTLVVKPLGPHFYESFWKYVTVYISCTWTPKICGRLGKYK